MGFYSWNTLKVTKVSELISRKVIAGEKVMVVRVEMLPRAVISEHEHPQEQISMVVQGRLEFSLDGETKIMEAGSLCLTPSNAKHKAKVVGDEPVIVLDIFSPIRKDFIEQEVMC